MIGWRARDHAVARDLARRGVLVALVLGLVQLLLPIAVEFAPGR